MSEIPNPTVPIAHLHPGLDADSTSVRGIVTLVWPYAASTESSSLLLVEPDFRLRKNRGQARIHFHGSSAKAVTRFSVGTGDTLLLSLKGSDWSKDGIAGSTPGKSIEWELRYGERLLLQVQRGGQEPLLLDVNHPPLNLVSRRRSASTRKSPPFDSHDTKSAHGSFSHVNSWQSPAFLKQKHFLAPRYDPFLDEEAGFPDNNRQKRMRLGHGSGQWRFAERTPSPEEQLETDELEIATPAKEDLKHAAPSDSTNVRPPNLEKASAELQGEREQQLSPERNGALDEKSPYNAPPSPPSTTSDSKHREAGHSVQPAHGEHESPQAFSSAAVSPSTDSESQYQSETDSQLSGGNGAAYSGSVSELALDGTALSRITRPFPSDSPLQPAFADFNQMSDDTERQPSPVDTSHSSRNPFVDQEVAEVKANPSTIQEPAHYFQFLDDQFSNHPDDLEHGEEGVKAFQSDSMVTDDELGEEDDMDDSLEESSFVESDADSEYSVEELMSEDEEHQQEQAERVAAASLEQILSTEEHHYEARGEIELPDKTGTNAAFNTSLVVSTEEYPRISLGPEYFEPQMELERRSHQVNTEELGKPASGERTKVEIINFESDDEEVEISECPSAKISTLPQHALSHTAAARKQADRSLSPSLSVGLTSDKDQNSATSQDSPSHPQDILPKEESSVEGKLPGSDLPSARLRESLPPLLEELDSSLSVPNVEISPQIPSKPRFEKSKEGQTPEAESRNTTPISRISRSLSPNPQPQAEIEIGDEPREPSVELPSTVPDSVQEPITKTQLLTPDITQPTSFASRLSSMSQPTDPGDDTLPTPQFSQNAELVALPTNHSIEQEQSVVEKPSVAAKDETNAEEGGDISSLRQPKKAPTLIEKLKAMRKFSSQTPQKLGDVSAVSPWFTSRQSSQFVPDSEGESEMETVSESKPRLRNPKSVVELHTPEKQQSLAKSFVRSPTGREDLTLLNSSPGYLPPSQRPPSGFRTSLSYFVPLATLQSHFALTVDILAIALTSTTVTRAKSGPRDYNQITYLTDPSSASLKIPIVAAQIFRSYNKCFPVIERGNVLLLREFKVQTFDRKLTLLSTQSSAWAVFHKTMNVQVRGPPVEYGAEERGFARGLWRWWDGIDEVTKERLDELVPKKEEKGESTDKSSTTANGENKYDNYVRKETIEGLGVDLPGSQGKSRKASIKEQIMDQDTAIDSIEPPRRVLRPRGAKGLPEKSESPAKATNRRSRTVFTGGLGEPDSD